MSCNDSVRIGIPVRLATEDLNDPRVEVAYGIFEAVVALIAESGAKAVRIALEDDLDDVLATCDGFVLPGGGDVNPALYGGSTTEGTLFGIDPVQDALDTRVVKFGLDQRRPVLGICRGMQLVNVVTGGTLHVDLEPSGVKHLAEIVRGDETVPHEVVLDAGSVVAAVHSNASTLTALSAHHQAIDRVGEGLRATGHTDDGCIEAVESTSGDRWILGVQWHPEIAAPGDSARLAPFTALRTAAADARQARESTMA